MALNRNGAPQGSVSKRTVTAKGDIIAATANAVVDRLPVGSDGQTLVADSSTSTGLRWQGTYVAGKNAVINGGFDIWQRSTSSTTLGAYTTADRWYLGAYSGTGTFAQETTVVPNGSRYSLKFTASATSQPYAYQAIETANAQQFAGQTVTLSMKLAASTSVGVVIGLEYSTSVDNGVAGTWTTITPTSGGTATPTTTTFITGTGVFAVPSTAKSLRVGLYTTSTIANTVVIYLGQTQLELGSVATTFSRAGGTFQGELAAAQRYYWQSTGGNYQTPSTSGWIDTSTGVVLFANLPVSMRVAPTSIGWSALQVYDASGTGYTPSAITLNTSRTTTNVLSLDAVITGGTAGRFAYLRANNSSSAYLAASAEL